ncbi:MAG: hypothetical protein ABIY55_36375 [Kofleriaceae bacterium]
MRFGSESRAELSRADAELAQVIAAARQGRQAVDCAPLARAPAARPASSRKPEPARRGERLSRDGRAVRLPATLTPARAAASSAAASADREPVVEIQRGGDVVGNHGVAIGLDADPSGIVILRYRLTHVASPE